MIPPSPENKMIDNKLFSNSKFLRSTCDNVKMINPIKEIRENKMSCVNLDLSFLLNTVSRYKKIKDHASNTSTAVISKLVDRLKA